MVINELVSTPTNNRNYRKYKELGYNFNIGDSLFVRIEELSKNSRSIIDVRCDVCGVEKKIKYCDYIKNISKYNLYTCSNKCANIKYKKTCFNNFGCEYPLQNKKIKENLILYFNEKYNVNYPSMLKEFELKKQETNLKKYGVKHIMFIKENINKIKNTKLEKFGDENYNNNYKRNKTKKERYNDEHYNNHDKCVYTCLKRYNQEYYNNHRKYVETCLQRYDVYNTFQLEETKENIKNTNFKKYGVIDSRSSDFIKEKRINSNIKKYNVSNVMQCLEIYEKQQKSGFKCVKYNNLFYRGCYELDFIKFCERIKLEIKKPNKIKYFIDGIEHYYFPDFFIPEYNLIIEIKSSYYYKLNENINILKKEYTINSGYNFLFLMDKDYTELEKIIKLNGNNAIV